MKSPFSFRTFHKESILPPGKVRSPYGKSLTGINRGLSHDVFGVAILSYDWIAHIRVAVEQLIVCFSSFLPGLPLYKELAFESGHYLGLLSLKDNFGIL